VLRRGATRFRIHRRVATTHQEQLGGDRPLTPTFTAPGGGPISAPRVLRDQPVCSVEGCSTRSSEVDHIVPVYKREDLAYECSNARGVCSEHHRQRSSKATRPRNSRGRGPRDRHPKEIRQALDATSPPRVFLKFPLLVRVERGTGGRRGRHAPTEVAGPSPSKDVGLEGPRETPLVRARAAEAGRTELRSVGPDGTYAATHRRRYGTATDSRCPWPCSRHHR
jgi:hypothetical protein